MEKIVYIYLLYLLFVICNDQQWICIRKFTGEGRGKETEIVNLVRSGLVCPNFIMHWGIELDFSKDEGGGGGCNCLTNFLIRLESLYVWFG